MNNGRMFSIQPTAKGEGDQVTNSISFYTASVNKSNLHCRHTRRLLNGEEEEEEEEEKEEEAYSRSLVILTRSSESSPGKLFSVQTVGTFLRRIL